MMRGKNRGNSPWNRTNALARAASSPFVIAFVIAALLCLARSEWAYFRGLDLHLQDYRLMNRGTVEPGPEVVIVAIDNSSVEQVGRWPWPRSVVGQLVDRIVAARPAVVVLDMAFTETSEFLPQDDNIVARPPDVDDATWKAVLSAQRGQDERLADALLDAERTVLGYFFEPRKTSGDPDLLLSGYDRVTYGNEGELGEKYIESVPTLKPNLPLFSDTAMEEGYFYMMPEPDGFIRRVPLVMRYGEDYVLPLALAALRVFRPKHALELHIERFGVGEVRFGPIAIPVSETGYLFINYRGPAHTFTHLPASEILTGQYADDLLAGKVVLVGVTATAVGDIRVTPFDEDFPGVEIHANVIDNILRGDFIRRPRALVLADLAVILFVVFVVGMALRLTRGLIAMATALLLLFFYLAGSQWIFLKWGTPLSLIFPVAGIVLTYVTLALQHFIVEEREKWKMRGALELYVSPTMARLMSDNPPQLGGETRDLTVFFSDIRGFTTISESLKSEQALLEFLNEYFGDMTDVVFEHDGLLDKYIGDAVMAVWGAPLPQPDHALRACRASLQMIRNLGVLNKGWAERGWPQVNIGIGLNTGPMVFGNMGSRKKMNLTVIGDPVNLGSRLEGLNKQYGTHIIISETTKDAAGEEILVRDLDLVRVKGKSEATHIYELVALAEEAEDWAPVLEMFHGAVEAYRSMEWEEAERGFAAVLAQRPDDGPALFYVERCRELQENPPGTDWSPIRVMSFK